MEQALISLILSPLSVFSFQQLQLVGCVGGWVDGGGVVIHPRRFAQIVLTVL